MNTLLILNLALSFGESGLATYSQISSICKTPQARLWQKIRLFFSLILFLSIILSLQIPKLIYLVTILSLVQVGFLIKLWTVDCETITAIGTSHKWSVWLGIILVLGIVGVSGFKIFQGSKVLSRISPLFKRRQKAQNLFDGIDNPQMGPRLQNWTGPIATAENVRPYVPSTQSFPPIGPRIQNMPEADEVEQEEEDDENEFFDPLEEFEQTQSQPVLQNWTGDVAVGSEYIRPYIPFDETTAIPFPMIGQPIEKRNWPNNIVE